MDYNFKMAQLNKQRKDYIIEKLGLIQHPEGGYFTETYRTSEKIAQLNRNIQTCIYFLLSGDDVSRFHRIKSDEIWFFHEGSILTIHTIDANGHQQHKLGPLNEEGCVPQILITKDTIFGATVDDSENFTLVSCTVAPGFDFEDFELMDRKLLLEKFPDNTDIIDRLT